jgi:predicted metal-binding protein
MALTHALSGRSADDGGVRTAQRILVCTLCQPQAAPVPPGPALIARLRAALDSALTGHSHEVTGVECLAACDHPCAIAWQAPGKATWLFGGIDPERDLADLTAFAALYQRLDDGWCRAAERPGRLAQAALARIPALPRQPAGKTAE